MNSEQNGKRIRFGMVELVAYTAVFTASVFTPSPYVDGLSMGVAAMLLFNFVRQWYVYGSWTGPEVTA